MRKWSKIFAAAFLLCLCASFSFSAGAQEVKKTALTRDSILVGDQIVWSTVFSVKENVPVAVVPYAQTLAQDTTVKGAVQIVHDFVLDTIGIKKGMVELNAKVLLTSFDSGYYRLPAPVILFANGERSDTLKLSPKGLYVNNIQVDTTSFEPYDIKGQIKYPITFGEILPWILLALAVAAIIWAIVRYYKMKKLHKNFFGKNIVVVPPHITALKKLEKLRGEKLWQSGKVKAYYTGVTDTLREYIQKRYGFGAMEKTSAEIMNNLSDKKIDDKVYKDLDELFKVADLVKFAKFVPLETDDENAVPCAVNFVNYAYMQELKAEEAAAAAERKKTDAKREEVKKAEEKKESVGNNKKEEK